jgi:hypothetical protein
MLNFKKTPYANQVDPLSVLGQPRGCIQHFPGHVITACGDTHSSNVNKLHISQNK